MGLTFPAGRLFPALLLLVLAASLAACSGDDSPAPVPAAAETLDQSAGPPDAESSVLEALAAREPAVRPARSGPARPYALGFAAVPAALTPDAYVDVFDEAARNADLIMIQRPVAWTEVGPGAIVRPETRTTIAWERQLLADRGLELLFAVDPWEPTDRGRLAGDAPGDSFRDAAVVRDYVAYAEFVVQQYRPRWLALAVDLDAAARARPDDVDAIEAAYRAAYAAVKAIAPETRVFASFQLEDLQGLLPWSAHSPQWSLILRFQDVLDIFAVSSFPSLIFPFASDIPSQYYSRLESFGKPIALVPGGYASQPGRDGVTFGTVRGQSQFLARVLAEAESARWELVVWLSPQDPAFAADPPFDLVAHMGLLAAGGARKPAWDVWTGQAARPWALAAATAAAATPPAG